MTIPLASDKARSETADGDLSPDRLRCLYEISELLGRFKSVDITVPAVIGRLSETLGLRSAVLVLGVSNGPNPRTLLWPDAASAAEYLEASIARAESTYVYLSRPAHASNAPKPVSAEPQSEPPDGLAHDREDHISLPLAVEHDRVFGVLQLEPSLRAREPDLLLASAVVNQLSVALDRQAAIEARQAAAAADKARAEAQRDVADMLRRRFEALLDNLDHAFAWEADATLKMLYVSGRAQALLGYPRERWLASPSFWHECAHPDDLDKLFRTLETTLATGTNQRCEHRCITAAGRTVWLQTGAHLELGSSGPPRLQGVSVDVSASKRLEEALRGADRRKNEFLAMLAHELRNPLAPIVNAAELLRTDSSDRAMQEQARIIIERQAGQLTRLIDDLLDVARITSGKVKLKTSPVRMDNVVQNALEIVRPLIASFGHRVDLSLPAEPIWVEADPARLEQVVQNLLQNAAKYTLQGGRIDITIQPEDGAAALRIRDTGVGIAEDLLPHVFDLFTQAETPLDRSRGGLGIGLALVKRLVDMHGGSVRVKSTVGQGTEFIVRLPAVPAPLPAAPPLVRDDAGRPPPLRILVVDDNVDTAESLAMLLKASGHSVAVAHAGDSALALAAERRPQVVFLDIGLPELNGYEIAVQLRRLPQLRGVVLVALTGYGLPRDRRRSREAGFDHHLVKPTSYARVTQLLREAAGRLG